MKIGDVVIGPRCFLGSKSELFIFSVASMSISMAFNGRTFPVHFDFSCEISTAKGWERLYHGSKESSWFDAGSRSRVSNFTMFCCSCGEERQGSFAEPCMAAGRLETKPVAPFSWTRQVIARNFVMWPACFNVTILYNTYILYRILHIYTHWLNIW